MPLERKYLTIKEASEYARIPLATLRLFRAQNRPPESFLLANRVMYDREKLDAWIGEEKAATVRGSIELNERDSI